MAPSDTCACNDLAVRSPMFGNAIALFAENRISLLRKLEYIKYRLSQVFLNL
ncbi:hypothetical protein [Tychonema sp. LEGE 06208]|uniref:hypothetical protein n=1 Tax=Microcoleaceae TaxID=1892252 RepID=UPI00187F90F6|nr:hypothetical protein [Tychonema sp. LEGE 06208]MBE9163796.1 hypothetical protein [Tychonema sp. LEGE 06208]